jgi:hypothetical protein
MVRAALPQFNAVRRHLPYRHLCVYPRSDGRVSEDITATPHRLDVMIATGRLSELLAELANEDIDDLELPAHPSRRRDG